MKNSYTTWINISKSAFIYNIKQIKKIIGNNVELMPIIKSNAYGHGLILIAKVLNNLNHIKWIGTASLEEALELRKNNISKNILVLSFFNPELLRKAIQQNIDLTVYTFGAALEINKIAKKLEKIANVHIKVDTGTSRLGFLWFKAVEEIVKISKLRNINIQGVFSHLSDAENINQSITNLQNSRFLNVLTQLGKHGITIPLKHIACSAGLILNKKIHHNLVRSGISIYGLHSIQNGQKKFIKLKPVLSWHTKIIQIKEIPINSYVGYNRSFKTRYKCKIALIPVGYWDGFDRKLSNKAQVLIKGKKYRILGNICMNLCIIDITKSNEIKIGEVVTLIGRQNRNEISIDQVSEQIGTINYEVVTRINPLIERVMIK